MNWSKTQASLCLMRSPLHVTGSQISLAQPSGTYIHVQSTSKTTGCLQRANRLSQMGTKALHTSIIRGRQFVLICINVLSSLWSRDLNNGVWLLRGLPWTSAPQSVLHLLLPSQSGAKLHSLQSYYNLLSNMGEEPKYSFASFGRKSMAISIKSYES